MNVSLHITPARSRVDEPLDIRISGAQPGRTLTLTCRVEDGARREWTSVGRFEVGSDGSVDLGRDVPLAGSSYAGVDPLGPLWSVTLDPPRAFFTRTLPLDLVYRFEVADDGDVLDRAEAVRHFGDGVVCEQIQAGPVVGTLARPDDGRAHPAVMLLPGSDGARAGHAAALLAAHGYTVLDFDVFKAEGRPPDLVGIELDEIDQAVAFLQDLPWSAGASIAVIGLSRGAELALQLTADNPRIGLVIAAAPSSIRQAGITANYTFTEPAWLRGGTALDFVPGSMGPAAMLTWLRTVITRRPMRQAAGFLKSLRKHPAAAASAIALENTRADIVLISGTDDGLWPSATYAQHIADRLAQHRWSGRLLDERCAGAGHFVAFPYAIPSLPPMCTLAPTRAFSLDFGGTPAVNAAAAHHTWHLIRTELSRWATA